MGSLFFCYDVAVPFGVRDSGQSGEDIGSDVGSERVGISGVMANEVGSIAERASVTSLLFQDQNIGQEPWFTDWSGMSGDGYCTVGIVLGERIHIERRRQSRRCRRLCR
jgi:hypothetical protein